MGHSAVSTQKLGLLLSTTKDSRPPMPDSQSALLCSLLFSYDTVVSSVVAKAIKEVGKFYSPNLP